MYYSKLDVLRGIRQLVTFELSTRLNRSDGGATSRSAGASRSTIFGSQVPRPFVKWAGGKSQLVDQLSTLVPSNFNYYFEPFVGGGALFFHLIPKGALISDANFQLINAYEVIRDELDALLAELEQIQRRRLSREMYERYRRMRPDSVTPAKRAARFIFLNKTCYNGLYRVNKNGEFNVPFCKYERMPRLYDEWNLRLISDLLQTTEIASSSYEITLQWAQKGDFLYLDPPYTPESGSSGFTGYTREAFTAADQIRLAKKFKELDRCGCLLMLSNSDTRLTRQLYSEFRATTFEVSADRMINCVGSKRTGFTELVILNYDPPIE